jgi:hypothetical protein
LLVDLAVVSRTVFATVATVAFAIASISYSRLRSKKALLLTTGFGLFFVHALISIPELFNQGYNGAFTENIHLLIDAIAILLLILGTLMG